MNNKDFDRLQAMLDVGLGTKTAKVLTVLPEHKKVVSKWLREQARLKKAERAPADEIPFYIKVEAAVIKGKKAIVIDKRNKRLDQMRAYNKKHSKLQYENQKLWIKNNKVRRRRIALKSYHKRRRDVAYTRERAEAHNRGDKFISKVKYIIKHPLSDGLDNI